MTPSVNFQPIKVTTPDGVRIDAQVWGYPSRLEVLFVHGMLQCHLSWLRQVEHFSTRNFRLTTYDFRGHGGSDKPLDPNFYSDSERLADELKAVMAAANINRPILVGWSFGTRIIADYLLKFGSSDLAGINLIAPVTSPDPNHFGPGIKTLAQTRDEDFATSVQGTRAFLRECFSNEPARDQFEMMLVYNASVPVQVRRSFGRRTSDAEAVQNMWRSLTLPTLITHGLEDRVVKPELSRWLQTLIPLPHQSELARYWNDSGRFRCCGGLDSTSYGSGMIPAAETSFYPDSGHAPFFEEPEKFNSELEAFVVRVNAG